MAGEKMANWNINNDMFPEKTKDDLLKEIAYINNAIEKIHIQQNMLKEDFITLNLNVILRSNKAVTEEPIPEKPEARKKEGYNAQEDIISYQKAINSKQDHSRKTDEHYVINREFLGIWNHLQLNLKDYNASTASLVEENMQLRTTNAAFKKNFVSIKNSIKGLEKLYDSYLTKEEEFLSRAKNPTSQEPSTSMKAIRARKSNGPCKQRKKSRA